MIPTKVYSKSDEQFRKEVNEMVRELDRLAKEDPPKSPSSNSDRDHQS